MRSCAPGIKDVKQLERFSSSEPSTHILYMSASVVTRTKTSMSEDLKAGCCSTEFTDAQLWSKIRTPTCSSWPASPEYAGKVF